MNKQQKEVIQSQLKDEKAVLKQLNKVYADALKEIEKKIQILQTDEMTQSKIYQQEHQKALKGQVNAIVDMLSITQYDSINDYLMVCYESGFLGTMYDLNGQGIPLVIPINQDQVVKAVQTDSKIKEGLYTKLGKNITDLKKQISAEISRGIATSLSYADITRNLNQTAQIGINNSMRIVRTEGHRIQQASAADAQTAAKKKGADVLKQWDSTLDGRTRETHRKLDGQIRELDEPFTLGNKKAMYPGKFNRAEEDINCRCVSLQRARWALDEEELKTLEERAAYYNLDKTTDFDDFKNKYLKASEKEAEKEAENSNNNIKYTKEHDKLKEDLEYIGVKYNQVTMHDTPLSEEDIINTLAGGDLTSGSCASLGLAYIGQKLGMNVVDYRGGESRSFFATLYNLEQITKFIPEDQVKRSVARSHITSGNRLLKQVEKNKQYYFVCGRHAAMVRKTDEDKLQYLELQSRRSNGWTNFDGNPRYTLSTRFGCTSSAGRDVSGFMIDVESFRDSEDLKSILGYINTNESEQKKGKGGYAK